MADLLEMTCTVHRIAGDKLKFKIGADANRQRNVAASIESSMNSNYIGVELSGKLILVPMHDVHTIEISPAPQVPMAYVVKDAEPAD
jgi:hypothetical protein